MEISVNIKDDLIESLGLETVKDYLATFVSQLELKMAAQDALTELATIDLTNDPEWQAARTLAWEQEKHNFLPRTSIGQAIIQTEQIPETRCSVPITAVPITPLIL